MFEQGVTDEMMHFALPVAGCQPLVQHVAMTHMRCMPRGHAGALLAAAIGLAMSCTSPAQPAPPVRSLDEVAEGYVRVALQLAQHNPDLVATWRGPDDWKPGPRVPVASLLARVRSLEADLAPTVQSAGGADSDRANYLHRQLTALAVAAERLTGASMTFDEEARRSLGVDPPVQMDAPALAAARAVLDTVLPGQGPLVARYSAFRRRLSAPPKKVEPLMRAALAACREASDEAIGLAADEHVDLVFGTGSQWDGTAQYLGHNQTRIEISLAGALDVTRALRLACHEGYPGHHTQYVLIENELVTRRGWKEFGLTPGFGVHVLVTEGAAEAGADLAFSPEARTVLYRDVLLPAAGLPPRDAARIVQVEELIARLEPAIADICRAYLDNTITEARAIERLRDEALTAEPAPLLAFAERRRTLLLAYPVGRARVRAMADALPHLRRLFVERPFALQ